jgi:hypothetical protein
MALRSAFSGWAPMAEFAGGAARADLDAELLALLDPL